jgi:hypothetical protein
MAKDYSVKGTTKVQREKYVNDAIALSMLGAPAPSEYAKEQMQNYIDGKCEMTDVVERLIRHYKKETPYA